MKCHIKATSPDPVTGKRVPVGLVVQDLPKSGIQKISNNILARLKDYFSLEGMSFVLKTLDGDIVFHIDQEPGRYCLTCGERLPDSGPGGSLIEAQRAQECRDHVATHGNKAVKTDKWPHGYSNIPNSYTCTIEDKRS